MVKKKEDLVEGEVAVDPVVSVEGEVAVEPAVTEEALASEEVAEKVVETPEEVPHGAPVEAAQTTEEDEAGTKDEVGVLMGTRENWGDTVGDLASLVADISVGLLQTGSIEVRTQGTTKSVYLIV
jgi:hypothetical protein